MIAIALALASFPQQKVEEICEKIRVKSKQPEAPTIYKKSSPLIIRPEGMLSVVQFCEPREPLLED